MKIDFRVSPRERGELVSLVDFLYGVGSGLWVFGLVFAVGGPATGFWLSIYGFLLFSVTLLMTYRLGKKKKLARLTKHFQKVLKK